MRFVLPNDSLKFLQKLKSVSFPSTAHSTRKTVNPTIDPRAYNNNRIGCGLLNTFYCNSAKRVRFTTSTPVLRKRDRNCLYFHCRHTQVINAVTTVENQQTVNNHVCEIRRRRERNDPTLLCGVPDRCVIYIPMQHHAARE